MEQEISAFEALEKVIETVGGQSALARLCGTTQPGVWKWTQVSKRLPARFVLQVEAATGVSRHLLRPDIYPREIDLAPPPSAIGEPHLECGPILSASAMTRHGNNNDILAGKGAA